MSTEKKTTKAPRGLYNALFCVDRKRGHYISVPVAHWDRDAGAMCPDRSGGLVAVREHPMFAGLYTPLDTVATEAEIERWFRGCARISNDAPLKRWPLRFGHWTFAHLRPYAPEVKR